MFSSLTPLLREGIIEGRPHVFAKEEVVNFLTGSPPTFSAAIADLSNLKYYERGEQREAEKFFHD